ncbi:MAG TPA: hypothetical protein VKT80_01345, partial [Chloroflexota bacterium]|nr:hypothetical protein [Chloroflexota bacterium]
MGSLLRQLKWFRGALSFVLAAVLVVATISVADASSIGSPSLSVSSLSATATRVTYSAIFVATSGLSAGSSTITLIGPTGTVFAPTIGCSPYVVINDTTGQSSGCLSATVTGGNQVVITTSISANPGDLFTVVANNVANTSSTGSQNLSVSTSVDTTPVNLPFTLTAPSTITSGKFVPSSKSATATEVTYSFSFTANNALSAGYSTITLVGPAGTVFAPNIGCAPYVVIDDTTGQASGCLTAAVTGGNQVVITTPISARKGDRVTVLADGVANSSTIGTLAITLATSSDPATVSFALKLVAATAVTGATLVPSSTSATATNVTYSVSFISKGGLTAGYSTITLIGPSGTVFAPTNGCSPYVVIDAITGQSSGCLTATVTGGNQVVITTPLSVNKGDVVTVLANKVTNSSSTGSQTLTLFTSSNPKPVVLTLHLVAPTSVSSAQLHLSSTLHGAVNVTYSTTFVVTNGLTAGYSTFTLIGPSGTVFAPTVGCAPYVVIDDTTGQSSGCLTATVTGGNQV